MLHFEHVEIFLKLGISAILGLIIGLERELKRKPLGLKTSLVISIISCLLTIVSIQSAYLFKGSDYIQITMDPLRLAAQIVSGIGFLGAGVILKKDNDTITGLTTAAMIWGASGIGIAVGSGYYIEAVVGVILIIISVEIIPYMLKKIARNHFHNTDLQIKLIIYDRSSIDKVISSIEQNKITIEQTRIKDLDDTSHLLDLKVRTNSYQSTTEIYQKITAIPEVRRTEIIN